MESLHGVLPLRVGKLRPRLCGNAGRVASAHQQNSTLITPPRFTRERGSYVPADPLREKLELTQLVSNWPDQDPLRSSFTVCPDLFDALIGGADQESIE